jgi:hypothetical protein
LSFIFTSFIFVTILIIFDAFTAVNATPEYGSLWHNHHVALTVFGIMNPTSLHHSVVLHHSIVEQQQQPAACSDFISTIMSLSGLSLAEVKEIHASGLLQRCLLQLLIAQHARNRWFVGQAGISSPLNRSGM